MTVFYLVKSNYIVCKRIYYIPKEETKSGQLIRVREVIPSNILEFEHTLMKNARDQDAKSREDRLLLIQTVHLIDMFQFKPAWFTRTFMNI